MTTTETDQAEEVEAVLDAIVAIQAITRSANSLLSDRTRGTLIDPRAALMADLGHHYAHRAVRTHQGLDPDEEPF